MPAYTIERCYSDNQKTISHRVITVDLQDRSLVIVLKKMGLYFEDLIEAQKVAQTMQNKVIQ